MILFCLISPWTFSVCRMLISFSTPSPDFCMSLQHVLSAYFVLRLGHSVGFSGQGDKCVLGLSKSVLGLSKCVLSSVLNSRLHAPPASPAPPVLPFSRLHLSPLSLSQWPPRLCVSIPVVLLPGPSPLSPPPFPSPLSPLLQRFKTFVEVHRIRCSSNGNQFDKDNSHKPSINCHRLYLQ